ncbi:1889_t:CDS:2 [Racocetra persica]|uniref:1889_t:CDS:1 n=1 Tax=Racocetra persica TaxID=160502 RepID=A0ACA9L7D2_9GLOM|nr:1889_t:CDS:2 [Racocetra persica]
MNVEDSNVEKDVFAHDQDRKRKKRVIETAKEREIRLERRPKEQKALIEQNHQQRLETNTDNENINSESTSRGKENQAYNENTTNDEIDNYNIDIKSLNENQKKILERLEHWEMLMERLPEKLTIEEQEAFSNATYVLPA